MREQCHHNGQVLFPWSHLTAEPPERPRACPTCNCGMPESATRALVTAPRRRNCMEWLSSGITLLNLSFDNREDFAFRCLCGDVADSQNLSDGAFSIGFSNSPIEYVGTVPQQIKAINKMLRVTKFLHLQTWNFWFPWEPHYNLPFIHWFAHPIRLRLLSLFDECSFLEEFSAYQAISNQSAHVFDA